LDRQILNFFGIPHPRYGLQQPAIHAFTHDSFHPLDLAENIAVSALTVTIVLAIAAISGSWSFARFLPTGATGSKAL
jgi:hypothetical protein